MRGWKVCFPPSNNFLNRWKILKTAPTANIFVQTGEILEWQNLVLPQGIGKKIRMTHLTSFSTSNVPRSILNSKIWIQKNIYSNYHRTLSDLNSIAFGPYDHSVDERGLPKSKFGLFLHWYMGLWFSGHVSVKNDTNFNYTDRLWSCDLASNMIHE